MAATTRDSNETRQEILNTALYLFHSQGYEATSLRQVADEVGLTKAALYYYFSSKEDLLETLVGPVLEQVDELLTVVEAELPSPGLQRRLLQEYAQLLMREREVLRFLARDPKAIWHPTIGPRARDHVVRMYALLTRADSSLDDRVRAACALGALQRGVWGTPHVLDDGAEVPDGDEVLRLVTKHVFTMLGLDVSEGDKHPASAR